MSELGAWKRWYHPLDQEAKNAGLDVDGSERFMVALVSRQGRTSVVYTCTTAAGMSVFVRGFLVGRESLEE